MSSTLRQQIAVQKLSEIIRNSKGKTSIDMGSILREAGYSKQTSLKPKLVTESKGFKELFEQLIPDSKIMEKLKCLLEANVLDHYQMDAKMTNKEITSLIEEFQGFKVKKIQRNSGNKFVTVFFWRPDNMIVDKALDKLIKIRGYYSPKQPLNNTIPKTIEIINYGNNK